MRDKAIICDLDQCLALIGERDPWDATDCHRDKLYEPLRDVLKVLQKCTGCDILFLTARNYKHQPKTKAWLQTHGFEIGNNCFLFMKKDEVRDGGQSAVMFKQAATLSLQNQYDILLAFDDDLENCEMYRKLGIAAIQVLE